MPEERDIEKQLKQAAKLRREQAPEDLSLTGLNRRALQQALRERYPAKPPKASVGFWDWLFAQRWIPAMATLSVFAGIVALVLLRQAPKNAMVTDSSPIANEALTRGRMAVGGAAPAAKDLAEAKRLDAQNAPARSGEARSAKSVPLDNLSKDKRAEADSSVSLGLPATPTASSAPNSLAASAPAPSARPKALAPVLAEKTGASKKEANLALEKNAIVQLQDSEPISTYNFRAPSKTKVLNSFRMEQKGSQVSLIDSDGSRYVGVSSPAIEDNYLATAAAAKQDQAGRAYNNHQSLLNNSGNYNLQATGMNVTLKKRVVVNAQVSNLMTNAAVNQSQVAGQNYSKAQNAPGGALGQAGQNAQMNSANNYQNSQSQSLRLRGKVQVGGGAEVNLDARQVPDK